MHRPTFTRLTLALAVAVGALAAGPAGAHGYTAVYAFGDSLSDNGNLFGVAGLPQAANYWNGRFSNGPVAVEVMAQRLNVPLFDFAIGGARTDFDPTLNGVFPTGLQAQIATHDSQSGNTASATGLYFLWAGSNDMRDAFAQIPATYLAAVTGGQDGAAAVQTMLTNAAVTMAGNMASSVQHLYAEGARNFFLPLLPDFGLTPEGMAGQAAIDGALGPGVFSFSGVSFALDQQLGQLYGQVLPSLMPDAEFTVFDTFARQHLVQGNPGAFGITNTTDPCFTGYVAQAGTMCTADFTTTYMYWDKVHPSAITHQVLGTMMSSMVPEPASMLMLAVGVAGLLGWKRRQAV